MRLLAAMLLDTHCHPHLGKSTGGHLAQCVIASTQESDWDDVSAYAGKVRCRAYGVHPWFTTSRQHIRDDWLDALRSRLEGDGSAICGEIGLDGLRGSSLEDQERVFGGQLGVAAGVGRPCTVHCVKAFGKLRDVLLASEDLPPALAMHSYGGSFEFARDLHSLLERRGVSCYFGFSWIVNSRRKRERQLDVIRRVPDRSILIETDLEDALQIDDDLSRAAGLVAEAKGWSHDETMSRCYENAEAFLTSRV